MAPSALLLADTRPTGSLALGCERSATHRAAGSSGRMAARPLCSGLSAPAVLASYSRAHLAVTGPLRLAQPAGRYVQASSSRFSHRLAVAAAAVDAEAPTAGTGAATAMSELVTTVHSPEEFDAQLRDHKGQLVILMCKAKGCRPCKAFGRKYARFAQQFTDAVFLEIFGDESKDTRKMMIEMQIKATPTFKYFRGSSEALGSHTGISEEKLRAAILEHTKEGEAGFGQDTPAE